MGSWDKAIEKKETLKKKTNAIKGNDLFMKIGPKEQVRFVGEVETINVAWINGNKFIVPEDYFEKVQNITDVKQSYAVNVIDRNDETLRFKVLEKGPSIFNPVFERYQQVLDNDGNKVHPGGSNGGDWIITKQGEKKNTQYNVTYMKETPFTKEEKKLISLTKKAKEDPDSYKELPLGEKGLIDLKILYDRKKAVDKLEKFFAMNDLEDSEVQEQPEDMEEDNSDSESDSDGDLADIEDIMF